MQATLFLRVSRDVIAALIGAVFCLAAPAAIAAAGRHAHTLPSNFHNGSVFIEVTVNGHRGAWMMLDSGTTDSMIDADYAASIGITLTPKATGTGGFGSEVTPTFTTGTVRLQVGIEPEQSLLFESIRLLGMRGPAGEQLAGLLGHSFLDKHVVVIDYQQQEVYFDDVTQQTDPRDLPMTLVEGVPRIQVNMANQKVDALIDTGGSYNVIITPATATRLGVDHLMAQATPAATVGHGGQQHVVIGTAPPFSVGTLATIDEKAAYTTFGTATDALGAGMSFGITFLKKYKLTLNYLANTVRLDCSTVCFAAKVGTAINIPPTKHSDGESDEVNDLQTIGRGL